MEHTVRQGECLSSIAYNYGFTVDGLLSCPENREINATRDPNVLNPGDVVFVPDKRVHSYSADTGQKVSFRRKNVPELLRVRFLEYDEPRSDESYRLKVDHAHRDGVLDSDGVMEERITPAAKKVQVLFGEGDEEEVVEIELGTLDPVEQTNGLQARLCNLGFNCGQIDGIIGSRTRGALREFQLDEELAVTGDLDEATRRALVEAHKC